MVYIKSLNKNIFPYYIKPEENELFSSWLCRLSYSHEIKTNSFIANYLGRDFPIWNRDIDLMYNNKLIDLFSNRTPLNEDKIKLLFLESYDTYITDVFRNSGSVQNILPLGINHRTRKRFGMQCCPGCLSKSPSFYRKSWRFVSSIICVKCNVYLLDRCFVCDSPIVYFRVNMDINLSVTEFKSFCLCYNCKSDLRNYHSEQLPSPFEIEYQKFVDDTIDLGYNFLTQYSFTYIRILLTLAVRICSASKDNRLRKIVEKEFGISLPIISKEIRFWSISERITTLPIVYKLLKDHPYLISKLFKKGKVIRARVFKDKNYIPYWMDKCFKY
ncbi:hypothetical protein GCQ56_00870 [Marinifilum sp. N1E240]|uniref:TniQ family protein n=1 Tax=Marinifilum sp. N1E240 TaxID=2608082 RepID=UPI00128CAC6A|nr:TniQ family protein [Marinifilum sp. N1E240]MPQ45544.1 hypothetical protein [Marinifilum sp. N1E240]